MKIILAGGGTLGSVSPLIGIYQQLKKQQPNLEVIFIGTKKGPEKDFVEKYNIQYKSIIAGKLRRYFSLMNLLDLIKIEFSFFQSFSLLIKFKPDIIISAGSFAAVPLIWASRFFKAKVILYQPDLKLGLANKLCQKQADLIFTALPETVSQFTKKAEVAGSVLRNEIREFRSLGVKEADGQNVSNDKKRILILGGGTGSESINQLIEESVEKLSNYQIVHITGPNKLSDPRYTIPDTRSPIHDPRYTIHELLTDDYYNEISAADLVISRAGLSTLMELSYLSKPAILIPLPDSAQEQNADYFCRKNAAVCLNQKELTSEKLVEVIETVIKGERQMASLSKNINKVFEHGGEKVIAERLISEMAQANIVIPQTTRTFTGLSQAVLAELRKVHFIGIGGIGVSAIAKMMLELGKNVTGSDVSNSEIIEKLRRQNAKITIGHRKLNVDDNTDLIVYSAAVAKDNPELQNSIPQMSYGEILGKISAGKKTIAVTGTNGKTTTSAILGKVLVDTGLDPTVVIGSQLKQFDGNFRLGRSEYLAVEADEYKANMLKIYPWSILLTSIDEDHLDFYKDLEDIIEHFQLFVNQLADDGFLFYNADDANIKKLRLPKNSFSCSLEKKADYWVQDIKATAGLLQFSVFNHKNFLEEFKIKIPGRYNILNSLMVIGLCHQMDIDLQKVKQSLAEFGGLWRRFEVLGLLKDANDVLVVSDYTHHPLAVKLTLAATKEFYPDRRLFLVYQPHQHNRTRKLFNEFIKCFFEADFAILNEIYDVPGRKYLGDEKTSSKDIVDKIGSDKMIYSANFAQTKKLIYDNIKPGDLLLIMGAGDIDGLARKLV